MDHERNKVFTYSVSVMDHERTKKQKLSKININSTITIIA